MTARDIYLDYNATTPLAEPVFEVMVPFLQTSYGNASSLHYAAREPRRILRDARRQAAKLLGVANENTLIFTSGGTESNNAVLRSVLLTTGKRRIVTSQVEHSSILKPLLQLEKEGCEVLRLPVDQDGQLDMEALENALTPETALVSLMAANNETGVFFDIDAISKRVHDKGILFHVDAVQSIGKSPINLDNASIDFLSLSGHKFYGPKGVGILYVRSGRDFIPLINGGSQERGRRGGTENIAGIAGLGKACELIQSEVCHEAVRLGEIRQTFENRLCQENADVEIVGAKSVRLPNTSLALFQGADAEALLYALDGEGIACSSGSACMSGSREPSHVLTAMGYNKAQALSAIRFSFGRYTSLDELEYTLEMIQKILPRLRA